MTALMRACLLLAGLLAIPVGCGGPAGSGVAANDPNAPGWTGRTTVLGSHSTIAGDAAATELQQKWQLNPNR
jgi:hypothetical protein